MRYLKKLFWLAVLAGIGYGVYLWKLAPESEQDEAIEALKEAADPLRAPAKGKHEAAERHGAKADRPTE